MLSEYATVMLRKGISVAGRAGEAGGPGQEVQGGAGQQGGGAGLCEGGAEGEDGGASGRRFNRGVTTQW